MKLIDYEKLEEVINNIEIILEPYDVEEKNIILQFVRKRQIERLQKLKTQEGLDNLKFGNVMKKILKGKED